MSKRKMLGHWFLVIGISLAILWNAYALIPLALHRDTFDIGHLQIYDRNQSLITDLPGQDGFFIPLGEDEPLPQNIVKAFTTIEDERFYDHWGVDALAKLRALRDNFSAQKIVSGGSTITEQWIKNKYFSNSSRTIIQKLREATLAFYFSLFTSKDEVFRHYLDTIYFGQRNYGIKAAMKTYFDKSHLEVLSEEELITLLAIIRSPGVANPKEKYFQERWQRIATMLGSSAGSGVLSPGTGESQREGHSQDALELKPFTGVNVFPHVTATIRQELRNRGESPVVSVESTVDSTLQREATERIRQSLTLLENKNVSNGAAYVVQPSTGDILVWVGSRDFFDEKIDGQVNILTQRRQMGSALKPFIYLYAFLQGAHPDQLIVDLEKDFDSAKDDEAYRPLNYGLREGGVMPLKMALANSFNISAVRLLEHLGLDNVYRFMKELGLPFDHDPQHYGLSLALGSPDLKMQDVADAYAVVANGGRKIKPHLIRNNAPVETVHELSLRSLPYFYLFETLSNPLNRRRSFGTNSILNTSIPFAVKTGTTKDFHDNWAFGYHPDLVVATWVGNNDNTPMTDVDGITGAGPIWHHVVEAAIEQGYVKKTKIPPPEGLRQVRKCLKDDCSQAELIYQEPSRKWFSDLDTGHYCLEDFFIKTIDAAEIQKMAKLFDFKDFLITWCNNEGEDRDPRLQQGVSTSFQILSPSPNETFYLRRDVPLDLQQIILRANQEAEWFMDGDGASPERSRRVGYGKNIFIQPIIGKHTITAKSPEEQRSVSFSIEEFSQ